MGGHQPRRGAGGAGERHLLPEHGADGQLVAVHVTGHPPARESRSRARRAWRRRRARPPPPPDRSPGPAARASAARPPPGRGGRSARSARAPAPRPRGARRCRRREAGAGCAGRRRPRSPPHPARRGGRGTPRAPRRRAGRDAAGAARSRRRSRACPGRARERRSRGVVAKTSRTVALNWRTLRKPAEEATSIIGSSVVSSSSRAVWARCARASASGPAPTTADSCRCRWRSVYPSRRRQAGHAVAVHHAVGDQPHRAAHQVGAPIPFGRARRGVRAAALARPEAGRLGRRRRRVEAHVLALRRAGRAARPAVDAGRGDAREHPAVEARVASPPPHARNGPMRRSRPHHPTAAAARLAQIGREGRRLRAHAMTNAARLSSVRSRAVS